MTNLELLSKTKAQKIGKTPVVILPLKIWEEIGERLEEAEVSLSKKFWKAIDKERNDYKHGKFLKYQV
ncbi:MAG: hypothetical protein AAB572_02205 [Patescibacteria group bacterium]